MEESLIEWLEKQQEASTMSAEQIPLTEVSQPWGMNEGNYQRVMKDYFRVIGLFVKDPLGNVKQWFQPILEELGLERGIITLVIEETHGKILLLAKAEPGNDSKGCALLAPSLQASQANLNQAHGGQKPPLAEILDMPEGTTLLHQSLQPEDGGRFFRKKLDFRIISVPNPETIASITTNKHRWSTRIEIAQAMLNNKMCNQHLREAISILDSLNMIETAESEQTNP